MNIMVVTRVSLCIKIYRALHQKTVNKNSNVLFKNNDIAVWIH
jgi:hypothetical protein